MVFLQPQVEHDEGTIAKSFGSVTATWNVTGTRRLDWRACECANCRNFEKVAELHLPTQLLALLNDFGIEPANATYMTLTENNAEDGSVRYEGHYAVHGTLTDARSDVLHQDKDCRIWIDRDPWTGGVYKYPGGYRNPGLTAPAFFVNFTVTLPWLLADEPN